jgi:hypothetical protein
MYDELIYKEYVVCISYINLRYAYKIVVRKPEEERSFVRAAHRLQNSMKMDHTGIGCGAMD